jgi:hypothetical protein
MPLSMQDKKTPNNADIRTMSGIRTHNSSVRADQDVSCAATVIGLQQVGGNIWTNSISPQIMFIPFRATYVLTPSQRSNTPTISVYWITGIANFESNSRYGWMATLFLIISFDALLYICRGLVTGRYRFQQFPRTSWSAVNALDFSSAGVPFESPSGHRMSWLSFLEVFLSHSRQNLG